jgi:peptidoglycan hydrolase CwlO-like protein
MEDLKRRISSLEEDKARLKATAEQYRHNLVSAHKKINKLEDFIKCQDNVIKAMTLLLEANSGK